MLSDIKVIIYGLVLTRRPPYSIRPFHGRRSNQNHNGSEVTYVWATEPTYYQNRLTSNGATKLPSTMDPETGTKIAHSVYRAEDRTVRIINCKTERGFTFCTIETALLRTCKEVYEEAAKVLYSTNEFFFDIELDVPYLSAPIHVVEPLEKSPYCIPGLPYKGLRLKPTVKEIDNAVSQGK